MFDQRDTEVSVETTQGHRPGSSAGDRLMLALAVLALVSGGLIGLSKILPTNGETADRSATPQPSAARASGGPTTDDAPLRTLRLAGEPPPDGRPDLPGQGGWARALRPVRVLEARSATADEVGVLQPGDAMYVAGGPRLGASRWVEVIAPLRGWVATSDVGNPTIERFAEHRLDPLVEPDTVFAGDDGQFLLGGWDRTTMSYLLAFTRGGNAWTRTDPPRGTEWVRAAFGPHGWIAVAVSNLVTGPRAWVWQSDDGSGWSSLGDLSSLVSGNSAGPVDLVGSPIGYVMTSFHGGGGRTPARVFLSPDGVTWTERAIPVGADRLAASDIGFYAYSTKGSERPVAGFSADGDGWAEVDTSEMAKLIGVAGAGDRFVALDHVGDLVRAWTGRIEQGRLAWRRDLASEHAFDGSVVTSINGGSAAIATGWQRANEAPLWWSLGADGWQRHQLPATFGGLPRLAAASRGGYVVVGTGAGALQQDPIMWASDGARLRPERRPFLGDTGAIDRATCAEYSGDLLDMMMNSGVAYAACRGSGQIAFRAYVVLCQGCGPVTPADPNDATWLAQPDPRRMLRLAPIHTGELGSLEAVLSPGIRVRSAWANQWVDVTGHFDDPASPSCRMSPESFDNGGYPGADEIISECRGRFVVTDVQLDRQQ